MEEIGEGRAEPERGGQRVGQAGREDTGASVGDNPEYGTGCRRRGGGADPVREVQHPEQEERRFVVNVKGDGESYHGRRGISRDEIDGQDLHPWIGWIQGRRNVGAEPTLRWRRTVLQGFPELCSREDTPVWRKRHCMPTGNGGEALVHCQMLPGAGRRGDNLGRGSSDEVSTKGSGVDCRVGFGHQLGEEGRTWPGQRDYGSGGDSRAIRYFGKLPSAAAHMMQGQADVGDGVAREGGEVPCSWGA